MLIGRKLHDMTIQIDTYGRSYFAHSGQLEVSWEGGVDLTYCTVYHKLRLDSTRIVRLCHVPWQHLKCQRLTSQQNSHDKHIYNLNLHDTSNSNNVMNTQTLCMVSRIRLSHYARSHDTSKNGPHLNLRPCLQRCNSLQPRPNPEPVLFQQVSVPFPARLSTPVCISLTTRAISSWPPPDAGQ